MNADDIESGVAALAALLTAVGTAIANLGLLLTILRHARQTHTIVNQQRTDAEVYQAITTEALVQNGIPVPPNPAVRVPQAPPDPRG